MQGTSLLLFAAFAFVLAGMYLSIRRSWFAPGLTSAVGIGLSIILMVLVSLAQNNLPIQAVVVGVLLGGAFSVITLIAAWYFHSQELRASYVNSETTYAETYPTDETPT